MTEYRDMMDCGTAIDCSNTIDYRELSACEIDRRLFSGFIRHQEVVKCRRKSGGGWVIVDDPFTDDWSETDYEKLIFHLKENSARGGLVFGAFSGGVLKGFISVSPVLFGGDKKYMDLSEIHVSEDLRRAGIGKVLFEKAKDWAKGHGAGYLYISSHSAVESQAFGMLPLGWTVLNKLNSTLRFSTAGLFLCCRSII